ncbi:hypothetical protein D3C87_1830990 [compost metagenome]
MIDKIAVLPLGWRNWNLYKEWSSTEARFNGHRFDNERAQGVFEVSNTDLNMVPAFKLRCGRTMRSLWNFITAGILATHQIIKTFLKMIGMKKAQDLKISRISPGTDCFSVLQKYQGSYK